MKQSKLVKVAIPLIRPSWILLILLNLDAPLPTANSSDRPARKDASLRFSNLNGTKRKIRTEDEEQQNAGSFNDLVKRTKTDDVKATPQEAQAVHPVAEDSELLEDDQIPAQKALLTKEEKAALKAKRKAAKKMLSFQD